MLFLNNYRKQVVISATAICLLQKLQLERDNTTLVMSTSSHPNGTTSPQKFVVMG